jgi:hypothetical protein
VERRQQELSVEMERITRKQQEIMREMEDIRTVERRFCENLLLPILNRMETALENDEVNVYLSEVRTILNNLDDFKEAPMTMMSFLSSHHPESDPFLSMK